MASYVSNHGRFVTWSTRQDSLDRQWLGEVPPEESLERDQTKNDSLAHSIGRWDQLTVGLGVGSAMLIGAGIVLYFVGDEPNVPLDPLLPTLTESSAGLSYGQSW